MIGNQDLLGLILFGYLLVVSPFSKEANQAEVVLMIAQAAYQNLHDRPRSAWALPRRQLWIHLYSQCKFSPIHVEKHFGIGKVTFDYTCRLLRPNIPLGSLSMSASVCVYHLRIKYDFDP